MPCNSDHMEPREAEEESREVAKLIVYLHGRLGRPQQEWILNASREYYGNEQRLHELTAKLCELCKSMDENQKTVFMYDGRIPEARRLADWWEEHQKVDDDPDQIVVRERKLKAALAKTVAELTDEDKDLLRAAGHL